MNSAKMTPKQKALNRKYPVLWNEKNNFIAVIDDENYLPLLSVVDDEYDFMNPVRSYPVEYLIKFYGWQKVGEI